MGDRGRADWRARRHALSLPETQSELRTPHDPDNRPLNDGQRSTARGALPFDRRRATIALLLAIAGVVPGPALAQGYPFSQRGSVSQTVAFTTIAVTYGRPVARGRALFGQLVPWDSIWHPGADSATRVSFDHDVLIEGHTLRAGEYSLWLIPREHRPWTVIFSGAAHVFHKPYPGPSRDALRVDVAPDTLSYVETVSIDFPLVLRNEAAMRIHWGTLGVRVRIKAPYRPSS